MSDTPQQAGAEISAEFARCYGEFWGNRWPQLWASLKTAELRVARPNAFSDGRLDLQTWRQELGKIEGPPHDLSGLRGTEGLLSYYIMDPASVYAAKALNVRPGDMVLDMCAAPGGKSLVLIEAIKDGLGEVLLNEVSMPRRERLKKVVQQYVDRTVRNRIRLTGKDGGKFALTHADFFDRILVDAPCSGEKHMLENAQERENWTPQRSKSLAQRQYALLTGALEALKPGGQLVYSTCTISRWENEGVVERLLNKKGDRIELLPWPDLPEGGESAAIGPYGHGFYFLPDAAGFGPIFVARFRKR